MKILIDIGHPAHVHYFRNFINLISKKGHEVIVCARDKDVTISLLDYYNISFTNRGKGGKNFLGKSLYLFRGLFHIYKLSKNFLPIYI